MIHISGIYIFLLCELQNSVAFIEIFQIINWGMLQRVNHYIASNKLNRKKKTLTVVTENIDKAL